MLLRDWIIKEGLKIISFADQIGVGRTTVWKVCSQQKNYEPTFQTVMKIRARTKGKVLVRQLRPWEAYYWRLKK